MSINRNTSAFTLIELMIVVAIMSMIATIGVPSVFRAMQKKDPLTQGVSDLMDACAQARSMAIIKCTPMVVEFHPYEYTFNVKEMPQEHSTTTSWNKETKNGGSMLKNSPYKSQSYTLDQELEIAMIDVNLTEHKDDDIVVSRFFPNGTADLLTVVIAWMGDYRRITVDIVTGLADFDNLNELATPQAPLRRRRSGIEF